MLIVEKIEGNIVTIEDDDNHFNINKTDISTDVKEGDIILFSNGEYTVDKGATDARRKKIIEMQKKIFS